MGRFLYSIPTKQHISAIYNIFIYIHMMYFYVKFRYYTWRHAKGNLTELSSLASVPHWDLIVDIIMLTLESIRQDAISTNPWWRHQMETFSALLAFCAGNLPWTGEFPAQRPVTRSFDVFFDLRLDKRLSKQSWGWWFETLSYTLWRHRNAMTWSVNAYGILSNYIFMEKLWTDYFLFRPMKCVSGVMGSRPSTQRCYDVNGCYK